MNEARFEFPEYIRQVGDLRTRLVNTLRESEDETLSKLMDRVPPPVTSGENGPALSVAFVGQYNAGKSTIISALTGKKDIPIDADVCTDTVTGYDWGGIQLLDTPGIHAGYADHDETTNQTIDRADLLVFVITGELFDDLMGEHFRDLAFTRDKAAEILLVVNKMGMDPGTPEVKLLDIAKVTAPRPPEDFGTVFIDAQSYLEGLDERDAEDRRDLLALACFDDFVAALDRYVRDCGYAGRLTTPLFEIRSVAREATATLTADMPEERAAIELLNRKRNLFRSSQHRIKETLRGLVSQATSDVTTYGDEVAETIKPGSTEDDVRVRHEHAQKRAQERCSKLEQAVESAVDAEQRDLLKELEMLHEGSFTRQLRDRIETALVRERENDRNTEGSEVEWTAPSGPSSESRQHCPNHREVHRQLDNRSLRRYRQARFRHRSTRESSAPRHLFCREVLQGEFQTVGGGERGTHLRQRRTSYWSCWCNSGHFRTNQRGTAAGGTETAITRRAGLGPTGVS